MRSERVGFPSANNHKLAARLDMPEGTPRAFALFAHCFTCTKDIFAASQICSTLTAHGWAVLRFDFTGLGHSEGEFANTNFSSNIDDLVAAYEWMARTHSAPSLLIGHSLGGAAVLAAAHRMTEVKAVATIAAPAEPAHVAHHFTDAKAHIEATGEAEVLLAGRPFTIRKQFLDDIETHRLRHCIETLHRALIVFHAPGDETVGIENAASIFTAAKHPKSFISLDKADHLLRRKSDADYVAAILSAWATPYIA